MKRTNKSKRGGIYTVPSLQIVLCEPDNYILQGSIESSTETLGTEYTYDWGNEEDLY